MGRRRRAPIVRICLKDVATFKNGFELYCQTSSYIGKVNRDNVQVAYSN